MFNQLYCNLIKFYVLRFIQPDSVSQIMKDVSVCVWVCGGEGVFVWVGGTKNIKKTHIFIGTFDKRSPQSAA